MFNLLVEIEDLFSKEIKSQNTYKFYELSDIPAGQLIDYIGKTDVCFFRLISDCLYGDACINYYEDVNEKVLFDIQRRVVLNKECIKDIVNDLITRIYVKFQYQTFQHALFQLMDCFANRSDITFELNVKN
jgi:hypothetical protein